MSYCRRKVKSIEIQEYDSCQLCKEIEAISQLFHFIQVQSSRESYYIVVLYSLYSAFSGSKPDEI